jgi:glycosyltransferase involved in cell wall biosynthesis
MPTTDTTNHCPQTLVAIPVYNEVTHVRAVLDAVRPYSAHILTINDGSTDGTAALLADTPGIRTVTHERNRGYGAAIATAFEYAQQHGFETLVTMDCDGQHEPHRIPVLLEALGGVDIVSGSRYLRDFRQDGPAPADLKARLGLNLTDTFCGFKAYRVAALKCLDITETGWGMPLQLWVQAARRGLTVREVGVPRLYLDATRAFGGMLNDPAERIAYYRRVIDAADAPFAVTVGAGGAIGRCPEWR